MYPCIKVLLNIDELNFWQRFLTYLSKEINFISAQNTGGINLVIERIFMKKGFLEVDKVTDVPDTPNIGCEYEKCFNWCVIL